MINYKENGDFLPTEKLNVSEWVSGKFSRFSPGDREQVLQAAKMIQQAGQAHVTELGDQLFFRGLRIAELVNELGLDQTCILASLVYPVFAYYSNQSTPTAINITTACKNISESCTELLLALQQVAERDTWIANPSELSALRHRESIKNLRKLLLAVIRDVRVVLLLIAEQVYKMRLAIHAPESVQMVLGQITRDLYIPLSNRLGLGNFKWELEDLAFRFQSPEAYRELAKFLDEKRVNREVYIQSVTSQIKTAMADQNITALVQGRAKHLYSIWKKMQRKGVSYDEIYDIRAFRVIVETIPDCYAALGVIHQHWQPIPKEFDDYIAHPKPNGYQSLHTAVMGQTGETLEIQIRTHDMHAQAELGVAAHWLYKEEQPKDWGHSPEQDASLESIRVLLADSEFLSDSSQSDQDRLKIELTDKRIYIFSPKGEVVDLPSGSTPLDYAYQIHTQIGHRCCGAKIDGKIVPLSTELLSGQRVEILLRSQEQPSRDWLNTDLKFVRTARALSKIRQWFKQQDRPKNIEAGRGVLQRELKRLHLLESVDITDVFLKQFPRCRDLDDLYASIGAGEIRTHQILSICQRLLVLKKSDLNHIDQGVPVENSHHNSPAQKMKDAATTRPSSEILIHGVGNLLCHLARCCRPVPGEPIVGYITQGLGVAIHRPECANILNLRDPKRPHLIEVTWGQDPRDYYFSELSIEAYDRKGLLRDLTTLLAVEGINVTNIQTQTDSKTHIASIRLGCEVQSVLRLGQIMTKIMQISNVISVNRIVSN